MMQQKILDNYKNFTSIDAFLLFLEIENTSSNVRRIKKLLKVNNITHKFVAHKSAIMKTSYEDMQRIVDESTGFGDVLSRFGVRQAGGNFKTLHNRCAELNIDFTMMNENKRVKRKTYTYGLSNCGSYDELISRTRSRTCIKRYIVKNQLIEYVCSECSNIGTHNGKVLVLQLDHINGIHDDNRLENLRFLCPNCHSQTETFAGKATRLNKYNNSESSTRLENHFVQSMKLEKSDFLYKPKKEYCECGREKLKISQFCKECDKKRRLNTRKFEISKEELEKLIEEKPMIEIGKMFGVSDNAVRRRCKVLGIELKYKRGYWSSKKNMPS